MTDSPILPLAIVCCIWPFAWGVCGFLIGRYRVKLRSPIQLGSEQDKFGFGGTK